MNYDAKDMYERWAVSKSNIIRLRVRIEVTISTLRDKNKEISSCEMRLISNKGTVKKLIDQAIEVSRLKVKKIYFDRKIET